MRRYLSFLALVLSACGAQESSQISHLPSAKPILECGSNEKTTSFMIGKEDVGILTIGVMQHKLACATIVQEKPAGYDIPHDLYYCSEKDAPYTVSVHANGFSGVIVADIRSVYSDFEKVETLTCKRTK